MSAIKTVEFRIAELLQPHFPDIEILTEWAPDTATEKEQAAWNINKKLQQGLARLKFGVGVSLTAGDSEIQKSNKYEAVFTVALIKSLLGTTNLPESLETAMAALKEQWNGTGIEGRDDYKLWPDGFSVVPDAPGYEAFHLKVSTKILIK